jgi:hypothetical protein
MKKANKYIPLPLFPTTFPFYTLKAVTTLRRLWGRLYFTDLWEIIYVRIFKIRYVWHQGDWRETINITRRRIPRASTTLGQIYETVLFSYRSYTSFRFLVKMQVFFYGPRMVVKNEQRQNDRWQKIFYMSVKTLWLICSAESVLQTNSDSFRTVCPLTL